jgi:putative membrane protein
MTSLATLPGFLSHFVAGLVLIGVAVFIYMRFTPHEEITLIRRGNAAAALGFGGAIIGFAIPVAASVANSANLLDAAVWSVVALVAQLIAFFVATRIVGAGWRTAIEERAEMAPAVMKASIALAVGLVNAACLST